MTLHNVVVDTQLTVLHVVSAGLTAASIAGVLGYVPTVIACAAGIAAVVSYTFAVLDSETFKQLTSKSSPPK
jgi:hypothetical protein